MYILKNALKSITRTKGRNILIGIIVLTIAIASCVALSIKSAAKEAEEQAINEMNVTASISLDRQTLMSKAESGNMDSMRELMQQYGELSLDEMKKYADSEYVKDFLYSGTTSMNTTGEIEAVSTTSSTSNSDANQPETNIQRGPGGEQPGGMVRIGGMMAMGDLSIVGYSSQESMTSFVNGSSKVSDGAMFDVNSNDLTCMINKELATFNELKVGDKITLSNPNKEEETYEFTIVGIYENTTSTEENGNMRFSSAMDPANQIYTSYNSLQTIIDQSTANATVSTNENNEEVTTALTSRTNGTYTFANKANYDKFTEDVKTLGLSEYYSVSSSDVNQYESSIVPLQNLSKFANTLLLIILGVGGIILIVLNIFNIRERKFEVGVLTAIGMKKPKVALQFVTELFLVTLVAIIIGTGVGAVASVPVANKMLDSQIAAQEEKVSEQSQNFGGPGMVTQRVGGGGMMFSNSMNDQNVSYVDKINAVTDSAIFAKLIGIGIVLTIISSLAAVIFVLRYEPLKILANRS